MADRINPGMGGQGPLERRIATLERFFSRITKTRIVAAKQEGGLLNLQVLAIREGPGKDLGQTGAFWGMFFKEGDTYLQGGTVSGGNGTITIEDIKVLNGRVVPESQVDKILWVEATVNGVAQDGVLLPGANVTSAKCSTTSTVGDRVPANTLPTASSTNGKKVYVEVGRFRKEGFVPSKQGHIQITFCPGSYTVVR